MCAVFSAGVPSDAFSQPAADYPNKRIRFLLGYPPGGATDPIARAVGQKLTEAWKQPVVIEHRPGAATNIASELLARSPPDGYTLFLPTVANAINPTLYPKLAYDPLRDFAFVVNIAKVPGVIVSHPALPVKSVKELIALAKAQPDALRYASPGAGSTHHLVGELFKTATGIKMTHVPYKGAGPALTDTIAGHVEICFGALLSALPHVKGNRLRALGVTSLKRAAAAPGVATLDEQGVRGFETASWYGVVVPTGTPREIVNKLNVEIVRALADPQVRNWMTSDGAEIVADTPEAFTAFFKSELVKWGKAVKLSGAKAE
jgi:tripartite-type tricarboxylate transporter receptor subunit TctC